MYVEVGGYEAMLPCALQVKVLYVYSCLYIFPFSLYSEYCMFVLHVKFCPDGVTCEIFSKQEVS